MFEVCMIPGRFFFIANKLVLCFVYAWPTVVIFDIQAESFLTSNFSRQFPRSIVSVGLVWSLFTCSPWTWCHHHSIFPLGYLIPRWSPRGALPQSLLGLSPSQTVGGSKERDEKSHFPGYVWPTLRNYVVNFPTAKSGWIISWPYRLQSRRVKPSQIFSDRNETKRNT